MYYLQRIACSLLIISLLMTSYQSRSQDLRNDKSFFDRRATDFNQWLTIKGLGKTLRYDSLRVYHDSLVVYLGSPYNDTYTEQHSDSLAAAWYALKKDYRKKNSNRLEYRLLNTLAFQMEVDLDKLIVHVVGKNRYFFWVSIGYFNKRIHVNEKVATKREVGTIEIPTNRLNSRLKTVTDKIDHKTLSNVRKAISNCLLPYYKSKGVLWYTADVEVIADYEHRLVFEVTDLNREILPDIGYFEYIRIEIQVKKKENGIEITYNLQGKYGSGIFCAPRKGDYKSMDAKYPNYMKNYEYKLINRIRDALD